MIQKRLVKYSGLDDTGKVTVVQEETGKKQWFRGDQKNTVI